jgi:hypothetical protein
MQENIKQTIWRVAKHNLYTIIIAKARINFDGDYTALLHEIERMKQQSYEHHHPGYPAENMDRC